MNIKSSSIKIFRRIFLRSKLLEIEGGKLLDGKIEISGAKNSALFAIAILSRKYPKIKEKLKKFRSDFESNIPKRPY